MRPRVLERANEELFRSRLESIVDPGHELVRLAAMVGWGRFDDAFGALYHESKGRPCRPG